MLLLKTQITATYVTSQTKNVAPQNIWKAFCFPTHQPLIPEACPGWRVPALLGFFYFLFQRKGHLWSACVTLKQAAVSQRKVRLRGEESSGGGGCPSCLHFKRPLYVQVDSSKEPQREEGIQAEEERRNSFSSICEGDDRCSILLFISQQITKRVPSRRNQKYNLFLWIWSLGKSLEGGSLLSVGTDVVDYFGQRLQWPHTHTRIHTHCWHIDHCSITLKQLIHFVVS